MRAPPVEGWLLDSVAMRLLLIRHGQTPDNIHGALGTARPGPGLTARGRDQARALPGALRDEAIAAVYASVLVRTQLTAAPLAAARGLTVGVLEGLEEIVAGDLELRSDQAAIATYLDTIRGWIHGDVDRAVPGGEDGHAFTGRYDGAIAAIEAAHTAGDTVAVVSHGAAIRTWVGMRVGAVGPADERWLSNTGMIILEGGAGAAWDLVDWIEEPVSGLTVAADHDHDVTGAPAAEAVAEAPGA